MKDKEIVKKPPSNKIVCKNSHTLAKLPEKKDREVIEIKCHRCRHYVYVIIDHVQRRIKVHNGSIQP